MAQRQRRPPKAPNISLIRVAFRVLITARVMTQRTGIHRVIRQPTLLKLSKRGKKMKFMRERVITTSAQSVKNTLFMFKMISIVTIQVVLATQTRSSCETFPGLLINNLQDDQVEELLAVPEVNSNNINRRILRTQDLQGLLANNVTFAIVR